MNGRKDQIVLVEVGHASLVASGIRRVEGKFGQKSFAARVAGRDLRKLYQVALADGGILVDALKMRGIPAADEIEFGGPARRLPVHTLYGVNKGGPILRCGCRRCEFAQPAHWLALLGHSVEDALLCAASLASIVIMPALHRSRRRARAASPRFRSQCATLAAA